MQRIYGAHDDWLDFGLLDMGAGIAAVGQLTYWCAINFPIFPFSRPLADVLPSIPFQGFPLKAATTRQPLKPRWRGGAGPPGC